VTKNCTLISSVRPNLQAVAFVNNGRKDFVCSTGFNVVQPAEQKLLPKFAYYALISEGARQYFEATAKGVGYPAVDDKDFDSFAVPLPPSPEQQRIAVYLDASCAAIDAAVTAKRLQLGTLDALCKAVIQRAITRGLSENVVLETTGNAWMKSIPQGWKLICLKRIAEIQGGLTLGKQYEGVLIERPYLRVGNVQDGHLDLDDVSVIELPESVAARVELCPDDVLMTEGGDLDKLGRGHLWNGEIAGCLHQNHIFAVRCFRHKLMPMFLAYVTAAKYGRDYFEATGKKTTNLACTNATKVGEFPIPLPPMEEQEAICAHLDEKLGEIKRIAAAIEAQITTLSAYRKSLVHECVTGQRRVTEIGLNLVKAHG
jgi:type I restriction enzyme, S subunit